MKRRGLGSIALYRELFAQEKDFLRIVKINSEEIARDGSGYNLQAETIPDGLECYISMSFDSAVESHAKKDDIWLCGFIDGQLGQGYLLKKLHNMSDVLHPKAREGETVLTSRKGKKINVSNDHLAAMIENAVLGKQLVAWLLKLTAEIKGIADEVNTLKNSYNSHQHIQALPLYPAVPPTGPTTALLSSTSADTTPEKTSIEQLERKTETDKWLSDLLYIQEKNLDNSPE